MNPAKTSGAAFSSAVPSTYVAERAIWAEVCCEQARDALRHRRYQAAHGLFLTAHALYRCALEEDEAQSSVWHAKIRALEPEMAVCAELLRGTSKKSGSRRVFFQKKEVTRTSVVTCFTSAQATVSQNDNLSMHTTNNGKPVFANRQNKASLHSDALCIPLEDSKFSQPLTIGEKS